MGNMHKQSAKGAKSYGKTGRWPRRISCLASVGGWSPGTLRSNGAGHHVRKNSHFARTARAHCDPWCWYLDESKWRLRTRRAVVARSEPGALNRVLWRELRASGYHGRRGRSPTRRRQESIAVLVLARFAAIPAGFLGAQGRTWRSCSKRRTACSISL